MIDQIEQHDTKNLLPPGAVIILPIGVPIPSEMEGADLATGTLYQRLAPLCQPVDLDAALRVSPIAGQEMVALTPVWEQLVTAPHVFTMTGLPGTRPDVTFEHACRAAGVRTLDWVDLSSEIAEKILAKQRASAEPPVEGSLVAGSSEIRHESDTSAVRKYGDKRPKQSVPAPEFITEDEWADE